MGSTPTPSAISLLHSSRHQFGDNARGLLVRQRELLPVSLVGELFMIEAK